VPIPRFLVDLLAVDLAGKDPEGLVFTTPKGRPLRNLVRAPRLVDRAATDAGPASLTPNELRHTAASLAAASGGNAKAVQRLLGHASAAMTLGVPRACSTTTSTRWPTGWTPPSRR
jgi:integrase